MMMNDWDIRAKFRFNEHKTVVSASLCRKEFSQPCRSKLKPLRAVIVCVVASGRLSELNKKKFIRKRIFLESSSKLFQENFRTKKIFVKLLTRLQQDKQTVTKSLLFTRTLHALSRSRRREVFREKWIELRNRKENLWKFLEEWLELFCYNWDNVR